MSRKRLGLKLEQMRKRHLQQLGAGRGGGSGRRKLGRWWRASWQRSRKRWQAGLNRTKKRALERDFRVVLSWLRQLERRVPRWRGRWFRDARRPGVDAHEPPHVRKKKRAGGTRSPAWLVPVTHFYLRTVTCLDWKARDSCYSWVVFFSLSSCRLLLFGITFGPQLLEHLSYRLQQKSYSWGLSPNTYFLSPGQPPQAPLTRLLVVNRTGERGAGRTGSMSIRVERLP